MSSGRVIARLPQNSRYGVSSDRSSAAAGNVLTRQTAFHGTLPGAARQPDLVSVSNGTRGASEQHSGKYRYSSASSGSSSVSISTTASSRTSLKRSAHALSDENSFHGHSGHHIEAKALEERPLKYRAVGNTGDRLAKSAEDLTNRALPAAYAIKGSSLAPPRKRVALGDIGNTGAPLQNNQFSSLPGAAATATRSSSAVVSASNSRPRSRTESRRTSGAREALAEATSRLATALEPLQSTDSYSANAEPRRLSANSYEPTRRLKDSSNVSVGPKKVLLQPLGGQTQPHAQVFPTSPMRESSTANGRSLRQRRNRLSVAFHPDSKGSVVPIVRQPEPSRRFSDRTSIGAGPLETDPLMANEYADEIYAHWSELEVKLSPDPGYMAHQPELSWDMRGTLVNWMVQVHLRFKLLPETLYLSVNMLDRFLSCRPVVLSKFQLVGISALFIACKFEEIYFPSLNDFVYACDNIYTVDEIRRAERYLLNGLKWEMGFPGPLNFLRRLSRADNFDTRIKVLSKYLIETTLVDSRFVGVRISGLVAAAVWLARKMIHWEEARQRRESASSAQGLEVIRDSGVGFEIEWVSAGRFLQSYRR